MKTSCHHRTSLGPFRRRNSSRETQIRRRLELLTQVEFFFRACIVIYGRYPCAIYDRFLTRSGFLFIRIVYSSLIVSISGLSLTLGLTVNCGTYLCLRSMHFTRSQQQCPINGRVHLYECNDIQFAFRFCTFVSARTFQV